MNYRSGFMRLVDQLPKACLAVYGDRLQSLALYGSVARGTMRPDSDIDLLLVAAPLPSGRLARVSEFAAVEAWLAKEIDEARQLGMQGMLAPIFKTPAELERGSFLFLDMTDEARLLFDRNGLLAHYLEELRKKLAAQGARRIYKGGGYYWQLKPDFRWGDTIEL